MNAATDPWGNAYFIGSTSSNNFPLLNSLQSYAGSEDVFVAKFDSGGTLLFSTYLGGSGIDQGFAIATDSGQNIWVGGRTASSSNFPLASALLPFRGGPSDAFLSRYVWSGSSYSYGFGTYLGGDDNDVIYGLGIDPWGRVWVSGFTASSNWPCTFDAFQSTRPDAYAGFISRIDGAWPYTYSFGSYFPVGSPAGFIASRLAIAPTGDVYVTGDRYGYLYGAWLSRITP